MGLIIRSVTSAYYADRPYISSPNSARPSFELRYSFLCPNKVSHRLVLTPAYLFISSYTLDSRSQPVTHLSIAHCIVSYAINIGTDQ